MNRLNNKPVSLEQAILIRQLLDSLKGEANDRKKIQTRLQSGCMSFLEANAAIGQLCGPTCSEAYWEEFYPGAGATISRVLLPYIREHPVLSLPIYNWSLYAYKAIRQPRQIDTRFCLVPKEMTDKHWRKNRMPSVQDICGNVGMWFDDYVRQDACLHMDRNFFVATYNGERIPGMNFLRATYLNVRHDYACRIHHIPRRMRVRLWNAYAVLLSIAAVYVLRQEQEEDDNSLECTKHALSLFFCGNPIVGFSSSGSLLVAGLDERKPSDQPRMALPRRSFTPAHPFEIQTLAPMISASGSHP